MSFYPPLLFDSSVAALGLVNPLSHEDSGSPPGMLTRRPGIWGATAMPIQFAPEPNPTANTMDIDEEQTTVERPLGFEFEFFGLGYTWFDVASNGFITFGTGSSPYSSDSTQENRCVPLNEDFSNFMALGSVNVVLAGPRRIAFEVRGPVRRRRLVLSVAPIPDAPDAGGVAMTAQVILHERTGMIEIHSKRWEAEGSSSNEAAVRFTTSPSCVRLRPLDTHHR
jgi:hypothetical protein